MILENANGETWVVMVQRAGGIILKSRRLKTALSWLF